MRVRHRRPQSLTSMIDVLFILVFASLAQAAAPKTEAETETETETETGTEAGAGAEDAGAAADAGAGAAVVSPGYARAREAGLALALKRLSDQPAVVLRISAAGELVAIEPGAGERLEVGVPLLERVPNRDVALAYLGDRSPDLQLCAAAARHVALDGHLIVIAPELPLDDLPVALVRGMRRDVDRCANALAVIAEPAPAPGPGGTP